MICNPLRILRDISSRRDLLFQLVKRDVLLRYRGAMFGVLWVFLSWYPPVIFFVRGILLPRHPTGIQIFQFMLATYVARTLLISYFSYRYIELPFLKMRER